MASRSLATDCAGLQQKYGPNEPYGPVRRCGAWAVAFKSTARPTDMHARELAEHVQTIYFTRHWRVAKTISLEIAHLRTKLGALETPKALSPGEGQATI